MDRVYGSRNNGWLLVHGGLTTMEWRGCSEAREVVVIAQREREEVIEVLSNEATWMQSCGDGHMTMLKRGDRWCFDGEMVLSTRRRYWSGGGCNG
jgi:hypothetical protein